MGVSMTAIYVKFFREYGGEQGFTFGEFPLGRYRIAKLMMKLSVKYWEHRGAYLVIKAQTLVELFKSHVFHKRPTSVS